MAHDDRDRTFEKALARHLRSSAPSGAEANASAGAPLQSCPDPEILAAYHEHSLSSGELSLWKEHVVACGHCQFVLAQLAATENIALDASPAQSESLIRELAFSRKQRPRDSRSTNSRPIDSRPVNSRPSDSRPSEGERRPPRWRWVLLIPAGAIAASLVAWVSLRTPKPLQVSPSPSVEVAENRAAPPVAPSSTPAPAVPSEHKEKDQHVAPSKGVIGGLISPNRDAIAKAPQNERQLSQQTPNQLTAIPAYGPSVNQQKQQQQQEASRRAVGSAGVVAHKKLEARAPAGISENAKSVASPAPTPLPPPPPPSEPSFLDQNTVATNSPSRVSPAPSAPASNVAIPKEKVATGAAVSAIGQASESVEVSAEPQTPAQAKAMLRAAVLQNPHVFVAPDGKHLWRLGPSGLLERSKDEGLKWRLQTTGVTTDLTAGSAPSSKVAWVAGNSGTILRTTDGGAHWTKLDSPVTNDITGVRAIDAFHASIWFVADPQTAVIKTYETADGGATWSAVPNP